MLVSASTAPAAATSAAALTEPAAPAAPLDVRRPAPIGLAELNASAGLLTRVDRKYLVPAAEVQGVINAVATRARVLDIDGRRTFSYASTYFDTPTLDSYLLAAHKRRRRFKVRTRSYLDSGLTFLEVKTEGLRGATVKKRIPYSLDDADRITTEALHYVSEQLTPLLGSAREAHRTVESLVPVMSTTYHRTTLHLPDDDARVTIDTNLAWKAVPSTHGTMPAGPFAVVETKNPATASPTDRHLWAAGHRPTRISKYATGMAVLHPTLPANRWHRVLTHQLAHLHRDR